MNDVLKSLTIQDKNGGKVSGLRYDSSEPLDYKLGQFPFKVETENASLSGFLNQLKGAPVVTSTRPVQAQATQAAVPAKQ